MQFAFSVSYVALAVPQPRPVKEQVHKHTFSKCRVKLQECHHTRKHLHNEKVSGSRSYGTGISECFEPLRPLSAATARAVTSPSTRVPKVTAMGSHRHALPIMLFQLSVGCELLARVSAILGTIIFNPSCMNGHLQKIVNLFLNCFMFSFQIQPSPLITIPFATICWL